MVEICVIVFPAKSICHSYTSAEARGVKASDVKLWPGICAKYFLSFPQKNLSPFGTWQFGKIGVLVNLIIKKLKSKQMICIH